MATPEGKPENLISLADRTTEEQRAIARAGGQKSGEVRREKKRMSEIYAAVLSKTFKVKDDEGKELEVTGSEMIGEVVAKIVQRGDSSSVSMIKELREGIDGNMLDVEVMDLTKGMTHAEKQKRIGELLAKRTQSSGD